MDNLEKMFNDECREKKIVARGIHNRASRKKGIKGSVKFPYEFLTGRAKKEYIKGGKVMTYNLLDKYVTIEDVPSLKELEKMDEDFARQVVEKCRNIATIDKLAEHWGLDKNSVYRKVLDKYGVQRKIDRNAKNEFVEKVKKMGYDKARKYLLELKEQYTNKEIKDKFKLSQYQLYTSLYKKYDIIEDDNKYLTSSTIEEDSNTSPQLPQQSQQQPTIIAQSPTQAFIEGFAIGLKGTYDTTSLIKRIESIMLTLQDDKKYQVSFQLIESEA